VGAAPLTGEIMPKYFRLDIERACWTCRFYDILIDDRDRGGSGPFCHLHGKFFPNPNGWSKGEGTKPGERVCKKWELK